MKLTTLVALVAIAFSGANFADASPRCKPEVDQFLNALYEIGEVDQKSPLRVNTENPVSVEDAKPVIEAAFEKIESNAQELALEAIKSQDEKDALYVEIYADESLETLADIAEQHAENCTVLAQAVKDGLNEGAEEVRAKARDASLTAVESISASKAFAMAKADETAKQRDYDRCAAGKSPRQAAKQCK